MQVLLVHGHWYYYRVALLVHYFFYKNVACFSGILFYCFYNNFSIQPLYDSINLTFYNITWTSAPIFVFALLEQNLSKNKLMKNPVFYRRIRQVLCLSSIYCLFKQYLQNRMMRRREFLLWFCTALWHGVVVFFGWVGNRLDCAVITITTCSSCSGAGHQEVLGGCPATSPTPSSSTSSASGSAPTPRPSSSSTSSCGSR